MGSSIMDYLDRRLTAILLALLLVAAGLRAIDLGRPVDGRIREGWREPDVSAVARNFYREGMNLFYPRIDWRGDGPGYLEMEFPLYPWTVAAIYQVAGVHEVIGRVLSWLLSLATLAVFLALARRLLPTTGVIAAGLFWAFNPLEIRLANAIQPEPLMLFWYVLAAYAFLRWIETDSDRWYAGAAVATTLTVLAKLPAMHIGVFYLLLLLKKYGWAAFRRPRVWAFGVVTLTPPLAWYAWAHHFWLDYGNSFGISNEYHWIGWDFFTNPQFALGILDIEFTLVWMPAGALVALYGLSHGRGASAVRLGLGWLAAVAFFYLIASRSTGDRWATYYHIVSVPPAALLFGWGAACAIEDLRQFVPIRDRRRFLAAAMLLAVATTFLLELRQVRRDLHPTVWQPYYETAQALAPALPPGGLLLASGGPCVEEGHVTAYNKPYFFYWLDRKGFNVCNQEQSIAAVERFRARGARAFVAEKGSLKQQPGFEEALRERYALLGEGRVAFLFDLTRGPSH